MSSVVIAGNTSGTITLDAPAVAGTTTLTLPATSGTVVTKDTNGIISVNGVQFPATQSASANANTLDDYEEGTWTPTWVLSSGSLTNSYPTGFYVKIGRTVYLTGFFGYGTASGSPSSTATVALGGFPFPSITTGYGQASAGSAFLQPNYGWNTAPFNQSNIQDGANTKTIALVRYNTTWAPAATNLQYQDLTASSNHAQLIFSAIYTTDN
jgi:hypothetical protein